ncbi:MAG: 4Fe-4S cluster-binding domain-containing protein, partial [Schwartzia sp.]|nr:4Fe-4S cluster-binding domain-containing protein [Schwartzia sp. (in: firmicutes)]
MRISTYEIFLPLIGRREGDTSASMRVADEKVIEGKSLLVNGLYGALDVVDTEIADKLEKGDIAGIPFALRERLTVRGHITRKDEEGELADARLLGRVWNKLIGHAGTGPVILPTYDCNFRCPYCFERHRLTRGQEWLGHEMKPEMVEAVFAALQKQRDKGHKIDGVSLYGGEPLLKENKETVRNICEHAKAMGLGISGITNGYDLDA